MSAITVTITNQKSKYLYKQTMIDPNEIIQLSEFEYLVPSENIKDKLYKVDIKNGLCECPRGALKGPCKHCFTQVQDEEF